MLKGRVTKKILHHELFVCIITANISSLDGDSSLETNLQISKPFVT